MPDPAAAITKPRANEYPQSKGIVTPAVLDQLRREKMVVIDNVLSDAELRAASAEMRSLLAGGHMRSTIQRKEIRSDVVCYLSEEHVAPDTAFDGTERGAIEHCIRLLKGLALEIEALDESRRLLVPAYCMAAVYEGGGAHYSKHWDNKHKRYQNWEEDGLWLALPEQRDRSLTAILYLNLDWDAAKDAGQLQCFPHATGSDETDVMAAGAAVEVSPVGGRLVLFESRDVLHQVLPTQRQRAAISLWILDDQEGGGCCGGGGSGVGGGAGVQQAAASLAGLGQGGTHQPGAKLRLRSRTGKWRTCTVMDVSDTQLKVHYDGFDRKYDEWVKKSSDRLLG
jgi:SM-20-related protein